MTSQSLSHRQSNNDRILELLKSSSLRMQKSLLCDPSNSALSSVKPALFWREYPWGFVISWGTHSTAGQLYFHPSMEPHPLCQVLDWGIKLTDSWAFQGAYLLLFRNFFSWAIYFHVTIWSPSGFKVWHFKLSAVWSETSLLTSLILG